MDRTLDKQKASIAIIMLSLNEEHNMDAVLDNIQGWAQEIFLVDSYSTDRTVDIALRRGVRVVQRKFKGFGDQWNFALRELPVSASWTMKLDPDERLTDELKHEIETAINNTDANGLSLERRLWFMKKPLPIRQSLTRVWRTGKCQFSNVTVNEYPCVEGVVVPVKGDMEHHDSPNLQHWYDKQNRYSTAEALRAYQNKKLAATPKLLGSSLQRRMWIKKHFNKIPFRFLILFIYHYCYLGAWRAGRVGYIWSKLRVDVYRTRTYKLAELEITGEIYKLENPKAGEPDKRVNQY